MLSRKLRIFNPRVYISAVKTLKNEGLDSFWDKVYKFVGIEDRTYQKWYKKNSLSYKMSSRILTAPLDMFYEYTVVYDSINELIRAYNANLKNFKSNIYLLDNR